MTIELIAVHRETIGPATAVAVQCVRIYLAGGTIALLSLYDNRRKLLNYPFFGGSITGHCDFGIHEHILA